MAVYLFKSTDSGAPTLSGTAGDLVNLLDKLLVDGYNSKTITITRSGSTATASCSGHGFVNNHRLLIAGAAETEYNGEFRITWVDANTFTFTVTGTPATPATGTITAKVAPLGWSVAYTGTNKRAYRQKAGTNQFYLRVDDTGTTSARVVAYETMSDVDTGTSPFPTNTQQAGGLYAFKSSVASATTRAWWAYSNGKWIYFLTHFNGLAVYEAFHFGDFESFVAGDAYNTIIGGATSSSSAQSQVLVSLANTTSTAHAYLPRIGVGTGASINAGLCCPAIDSNNIGQGNAVGNNYNYPSINMGGLLLARILVYDGDTNGALRGPRGRISGLWNHMHISGLLAGDTFSGAAGSSLAGRSFEVRQGGSSANALLTFETSDTWD